MINISEKQSTVSPQFSQSTPAESLESSIQAALEHARRLTEMHGVESVETALAWEVVEELKKAQREQKAKIPTPFEQYCNTYPEAVECRIYEL